MNILLTDGDSRAALAVTRSLGAKGHHIFVGSEQAKSLASSSKYCFESLAYPSPRDDPEDFARFLIEYVGKNKIDVLLPMTDVSLLLVSKHRNSFPTQCLIPISSDEAIHAAADKNNVLELARSVGMSVPGSYNIASHDLIESSINNCGLKYPVVIKPTRSRIRSHSGWIFTHVEYAENHEQLSRKLKALDPLAYPVVLQERVVGTGSGAFYCYNKGVCIAKFAHARIREKPPSGGVSVVRESRRVDSTVDKYSQALLSKLNWHGVAMVELKIDQTDGSAYLMEINGRFWGSLQLAIDAGVDFPNILINMDKMVENSADQKPYKVGVRSRWFWGDVDLLLLYLLKSGRSLNLPENHPGRLRAILSILKPYTQNQTFEILRISDIAPWLYESRKWIKNNFRI